MRTVHIIRNRLMFHDPQSIRRPSLPYPATRGAENQKHRLSVRIQGYQCAANPTPHSDRPPGPFTGTRCQLQGRRRLPAGRRRSSPFPGLAFHTDTARREHSHPQPRSGRLGLPGALPDRVRHSFLSAQAECVAHGIRHTCYRCPPPCSSFSTNLQSVLLGGRVRCLFRCPSLARSGLGGVSKSRKLRTRRTCCYQ